MRSKLLSSEDLTGLRNLNDESSNLMNKANHLINSLVNEFGGGYSIGGLPPMTITKADKLGILGEVTSDFGKGRFVTNFGTEGVTVRAQLIVERSIFDQNGQEVWEPVLAILLPKPVWQVDGEPIRDGNRIFVLGASILHAIINGAAAE